MGCSAAPALLEGFFVCCLSYFGSTYFNSRQSLHHYPFLLNKYNWISQRSSSQKFLPCAPSPRSPSSGCDAVTAQLGWAFSVLGLTDFSLLPGYSCSPGWMGETEPEHELNVFIFLLLIFPHLVVHRIV